MNAQAAVADTRRQAQDQRRQMTAVALLVLMVILISVTNAKIPTGHLLSLLVQSAVQMTGSTLTRKNTGNAIVGL